MTLESIGYSKYYNYRLHRVLSVFPTREAFLDYDEACSAYGNLINDIA
eukprot:CAMPEP_0114526986 /NCGR_PEP_ID=MMETSP0109-20121206/23354_1 /TAXON_ID=29199 /ORGANISM="Chlorarachnion reptans, Strain CCCM449" /LENGTH=47 /DNA_ID= /DNA_START= /DNA_END= /DNA_ORIENTATION=